MKSVARTAAAIAAISSSLPFGAGADVVSVGHRTEPSAPAIAYAREKHNPRGFRGRKRNEILAARKRERQARAKQRR